MPQSNLISSVIRPEVLALSSYHVADAQGFIKLDAMENPYTWPEAIQQQWLAALKDAPINRYPDPKAKVLCDTIKRIDNLPEHTEILLGNGSDEIIQMLLMALPNTASVLAPAPGFVMYKQISRSLGLDYHGIPLLADSFDLDLPAMLDAIKQHQHAVIFLAYPNNPTGNLYRPEAMLAIIKAAPGLVVVDEAYAPFADASFLEHLGAHENLLVMRTVSKLGLAGLRLGYLVASPVLIEQLDKIRLPYNINILTQLSADFALSQHDLFKRQTQTLCEERTKVSKALNELGGIKAYPSFANFILFKAPAGKAGAIFESIKQQGVLIKNMHPQGGLLTDCLRVTIGKPEENEAFLKALKTALAAIGL